jgi:hypothetical protein
LPSWRSSLFPQSSVRVNRAAPVPLKDLYPTKCLSTNRPFTTTAVLARPSMQTSANTPTPSATAAPLCKSQASHLPSSQSSHQLPTSKVSPAILQHFPLYNLPLRPIPSQPSPSSSASSHG